MENKSHGVGSALVSAGHGQFSVIAFREIAANWHLIYLGSRMAAQKPASGGHGMYLFDFGRDLVMNSR
jgi:hypothetical protein